MTRNRLKLLAMTSLAINILLIFVGRGVFGLSCLILPLSAVGLFFLFIGYLGLTSPGNTPGGLSTSRRYISLGIIAGSCLVSVPLGGLLNRYDIEQAKRFCDRLRPKLDLYKAAIGRYPEELPKELTEGPLPRLLESHFYYSPKDGSWYSFDFIDHSGMFNGVQSGSGMTEWNEWD